MSIDDKQSVSWVYELNKEQLIAQLEKRELPITGYFVVLRQRLLSVVRLILNPQDPLSLLTEENPPQDPLYKNPEKDRVNTASQTEIDFSYFNLIDNLISVGKLPSYSQYIKDKQSQRSVDENAQARPKYGESYHVSQNQDQTRVADSDYELEIPSSKEICTSIQVKKHSCYVLNSSTVETISSNQRNIDSSA